MPVALWELRGEEGMRGWTQEEMTFILSFASIHLASQRRREVSPTPLENTSVIWRYHKG